MGATVRLHGSTIELCMTRMMKGNRWRSGISAGYWQEDVKGIRGEKRKKLTRCQNVLVALKFFSCLSLFGELSCSEMQATVVFQGFPACTSCQVFSLGIRGRFWEPLKCEEVCVFFCIYTRAVCTYSLHFVYAACTFHIKTWH